MEEVGSRSCVRSSESHPFCRGAKTTCCTATETICAAQLDSSRGSFIVLQEQGILFSVSVLILLKVFFVAILFSFSPFLLPFCFTLSLLQTRFMMAVNAATASWNKNLSVKFGLGVSLFTNALLSLGTERHLPFYDAVWENRVSSVRNVLNSYSSFYLMCQYFALVHFSQFLFALGMTEVGHGSNTKRVRTTATYDPKTQEFIINTPDFEAAKCWAGNLGMCGSCVNLMFFVFF